MADLDYIINFTSNTLGIDNANSAVGKLGVALAALGVGFAAFKVVGFLSDATKGAAEFEQQLATVQAVSGSTVEQMERIKKASVELGESTRYNATQAAEGFEILARAGLNTEQALETIPSVLALAQGNALGLSEAAGFVTKAVQGMGLEFSESARVADVLAKASASANTDVSGLGAALSYAAPTANSLGITLEETAAYIGKFADAGVDASRAGTALNGILSQFGNSASSFKRELANIGITTNDFNEAVRQLAASGDKGQKSINALGLEAGPAFKALLSQGMDSLDELTNKLNEAGGTAEEQANVMNNTFQGAFAGLDSIWSSVKDTLGEPILEPLSQAFKDVGLVIGDLIDSGKIEQLGISIGEVFTEAAVYVVDFIKNIDMSAVIDKVSNSLETLSGISVAANGAFQALSIGANGLKSGFLAIGVAMSMVVTLYAEMIKLVVDGGSSVANFFGISTEAAEKLSGRLGGVLEAAESFRDYGTDGIAEAGASISKSFDSIAGKADDTAVSLVDAGVNIRGMFGGIVEDAFLAEQGTAEATAQIRANVNKMMDGFTKPEQFEKLLEVIIETGSEAVVGAEALKRMGQSAVNGAEDSTSASEKAKKALENLGNAAEIQAEKTRQSIDTTFSTLGIDVAQNLNGINSKTQQTFDMIASGSKDVADSTYSAAEKAALLAALFEKGLNAATTKEEFKELNEIIRFNGLSAVVTAEQQKILQAGMSGGASAVDAAATAAEKQTAALDQNAIAATKSTASVKENANARNTQAIATNQAAIATDIATQNESASLAVMLQMTAQIKGKIAALEQLGATTGQTDAAFAKFMDSVGTFDGQRFLGVQDFANTMQRVNDAVETQVVSFTQAKNRADEMTQALSGNAVTSRDLADAQQALRKATDASVQGLIRMDSQTLSGLQSAIDGARSRMQGLSDDAKRTAENLEATLAKLQGNEDKARDIEQTKKLTDLEDLLADARKRGNADEIRFRTQALDLQKQINREEDKKAKTEQLEQSQRAQEQQRKSSFDSAVALRKTIGDNTDAQDVVDALDARIEREREEAAKLAVEQFMQQLKDEAKRRT